MEGLRSILCQKSLLAWPQQQYPVVVYVVNNLTWDTLVISCGGVILLRACYSKIPSISSCKCKDANARMRMQGCECIYNKDNATCCRFPKNDKNKKWHTLNIWFTFICRFCVCVCVTCCSWTLANGHHIIITHTACTLPMPCRRRTSFVNCRSICQFSLLWWFFLRFVYQPIPKTRDTTAYYETPLGSPVAFP